MGRHSLIYGGINRYRKDFYYENIKGFGVRVITEDQFVRENPMYSQILRFEGTEEERSHSIRRAQIVIGKLHDPILFNCEHYANYVQMGDAYCKRISNLKLSEVASI